MRVRKDWTGDHQYRIATCYLDNYVVSDSTSPLRLSHVESTVFAKSPNISPDKFTHLPCRNKLCDLCKVILI